MTETGLIGSTALAAKIIRFAGTVIIFAAVIGSFVFARKDEKIFPGEEL